ncbi:GYDIA family GHMP kinase [Mesonia aquimarina]|uniref:GYDIA family GHMP kinase n=1 Tax=Mesonia aquimarina TaxID=1504967 RepID=UPI000EF5CE17|nr:GYDIA family GHMP kinase [Mesonia aquimarina]
MDKQVFYSPGKLLISGEYLVLDGAKALAVPTKFGQELRVEKTDSPYITWKSNLHNGNLWFKTQFKIKAGKIQLRKTEQKDKAVSQRLLQIFEEIEKIRPNFLQNGLEFESSLGFPQNWGLGSSSTLINNLAEWAEINPYILLQNTFGGSGYDIACAKHKTPLFYQLIDKNPIVKEINFKPDFSSELFFVHLNRKQNSRDSIQHYKNQNLAEKDKNCQEISGLTEEILHCKTIKACEKLLRNHEEKLSEILNTRTIQEELFSDYSRQIKSLGGWGGDFILATGREKEKTYFQEKGFSTILSWEEMIKS